MLEVRTSLSMIQSSHMKSVALPVVSAIWHVFKVWLRDSQPDVVDRDNNNGAPTKTLKLNQVHNPI